MLHKYWRFKGAVTQDCCCTNWRGSRKYFWMEKGAEKLRRKVRRECAVCSGNRCVRHALQWQFRLYIPFLGIARPQPQFPHSCVLSDFYIPMISLHISSSRTGRPIVLPICYPLPVNVTKYKNYRNLYNTLIRKSKSKYFEDSLNENVKNPKKTWEILKEATVGTNFNPKIEKITVGGKQISDPVPRRLYFPALQ